MRVEVYDLKGNLKGTFYDVEEFIIDQSLGLPLVYEVAEDDLAYYPRSRIYHPAKALVCNHCGKAENEYPMNKEQEDCKHEYPTELLELRFQSDPHTIIKTPHGELKLFDAPSI